MKKLATLILAMTLCLSVSLAAAETELVVFAAASMTEALNEIAVNYKKVEPDVTLVFNFDSSGTLKTQLCEGAEADIFISAGQKQMNEIDITADASVNTEGNDLVMDGTRFDLLTNTVVLVVPSDSTADISSFEDVAGDKVSLMALGNSDVPVGQYAHDVFEYLGIWQKLNDQGKITFASNVKEVLAQVEASAVDCGVTYISDAVTSDGVRVAASAPEGSHKPVCYPAAALKGAKSPEAALAFLEYLKGEECAEVFKRIGFGVPER